jgi:hypothetical protein
MVHQIDTAQAFRSASLSAFDARGPGKKQVKN